jgi:hypothetical protein
MTAGVTGGLSEIADIVKLVEAAAAKPGNPVSIENRGGNEVIE